MQDNSEKHFILQRLTSSDEGTFGILYDAKTMKNWYTLELPWRNNEKNKSCILPGTYDAVMRYSPKFNKNYYRLNDSQTLPRTAILIHPANWSGDKDKGYISQLDGCIALGTSIGTLQEQRAVLNSVTAVNDFMRYNLNNPFKITIIEVNYYAD